jgi:hypothetical protein
MRRWCSTTGWLPACLPAGQVGSVEAFQPAGRAYSDGVKGRHHPSGDLVPTPGTSALPCHGARSPAPSPGQREARRTIPFHYRPRQDRAGLRATRWRDVPVWPQALPMVYLTPTGMSHMRCAEFQERLPGHVSPCFLRVAATAPPYRMATVGADRTVEPVSKQDRECLSTSALLPRSTPRTRRNSEPQSRNMFDLLRCRGDDGRLSSRFQGAHRGSEHPPARFFFVRFVSFVAAWWQSRVLKRLLSEVPCRRAIFA